MKEGREKKSKNIDYYSHVQGTTKTTKHLRQSSLLGCLTLKSENTRHQRGIHSAKQKAIACFRSSEEKEQRVLTDRWIYRGYVEKAI